MSQNITFRFSLREKVYSYDLKMKYIIFYHKNYYIVMICNNNAHCVIINL